MTYIEMSNNPNNDRQNNANSNTSEGFTGQVDMSMVFRAIAEIGTGYLSNPQYRVRTKETDDDGNNEETETLDMSDFLAKALAKHFLDAGYSRDFIIEQMARAGYTEENLLPNSDRYMTVLTYRGGSRKHRTRRNKRT